MLYSILSNALNVVFSSKPLPGMLEDPVIGKLAKKYKKSNSQILLRFLIERNIVPIPKSVTPTRIVENFDVFDFSLSRRDMKELESLDLGERARISDFEFFPE